MQKIGISRPRSTGIEKEDTGKIRRGKAAGKISRGARTRAKIIECAIEEFAAHGYHDAKISNIVAKAGLTQPSFYIYFTNKDAIHEYLVERVRAELTAIIQSVRVPSGLPGRTAEEKITAAIEAFLQYFVDNPKLAKIGYFQAASASAIRKEVIAVVSRNIAFEQGAGYFRSDFDPVFLSECYNGSLERVISDYLFPGTYSARELAKRVADIYLRGISPAKNARSPRK